MFNRRTLWLLRRLCWLISSALLLTMLGLPGLPTAVGAIPLATLSQSSPFDCAMVTEITQSECAALVDFYTSTGGPGWLDKSNWLQTSTPCSWDGSQFKPLGWVGVHCLFGNVTWLSLTGNRLSGPLPATIAHFPALQLLALNDNQLQGELPPALGQATLLIGLYLSSNQFSGPIPAELGNLTNLQTLALATNYLTGPIPAQLGALSQLNNLYLNNNRLQGPIPATLGNLQGLTALRLDQNQLTGAIPPALTNLTTLDFLTLNDNQLQGELPAGLERLINLKTLHLDNNRLTGPLPPALSQLVYLESLSLFKNQFSGPLPAAWGQLHNVKEVFLADNQLSGPLPPNLGQLSHLSILILSGNGFTGAIPPELSKLTALAHLGLQYNQLSGEIPPGLEKLTNLRKLWLQGNQLSGSIPAGLGNLTQLTQLRLHDNQLSGALPATLGNLTQLTELTVGNNRLTGNIPATVGNLIELRWLDLQGNHLDGVVPPELGKLIHLRNFYLQNNQLHSALPLGIVKMHELVEAKLDYNALYAPLPTLQELLDAKAAGWSASQTLPPNNLLAHQQASSALALTWTPLLYTLDGGFYEVSYATDPTGPFTVHGQTANKRSLAYTVDGLAAATTYYFRVRTYTPAHHAQKNALWSDYSPVITAATSSRSAGDDFEEDNTCPAARIVAVDGRLLDRTFHSPGDRDWLQGNGQAGVTYRIDVQIPADSPVDVNVSVYLDCNGTPVAQQNEAFSNGARLDFQPTQAGPFWLQFTNTPGEEGGEGYSYRVAIRALGEEAQQGAVILVAGGLAGNAPRQANIDTVADAAYTFFRSNGFRDENIRYLAATTTLPGVDDAITPTLLRDAIASWALDKVAPQQALTLYLIGNGEPGRFLLDETTGAGVTVDELNRWLTQLEESRNGVPINVIIDAPYAGSFISSEPSVSKPGRVILTATTANQRAFAATQGLHFSNHLLTALRQGQHLFGAFWETRTALYASHHSRNGDMWQTPWLDADGNGVANEVEDALQASLRSFANPNRVAAADLWPPTVTTVRLVENILQATVNDNRTTPVRVWAQIYAPNYTPTLTGSGFIAEDATEPQVTFVALEAASNGQYAANVNGLQREGPYRFIIYAQDDDGLQARPVEVTEIMRIIPLDQFVYLPVAQR